MYQVQRIQRSERKFHGGFGTETEPYSEPNRLTIDLDYGVNHLMMYTAGFNQVYSDTSARVYKFYPDAGAPFGGYDYTAECSNRGVCDRDSGLCDCFSGYTKGNCDTPSGTFQ